MRRGHCLGISTTLSTVILVVATASVALGATFTVDVLTDGVDADPNDFECLTAVGDCTLRAALQQAETAPGGPHTIRLPLFGTYTLDICCDQEDAGAEGDLDINAWVEIVGVRPDLTIIEQTIGDRVFDCESSSNGPVFTLRNLTVTGGSFTTSTTTPQDGAGIRTINCGYTLDNVVVGANINASTGKGCNIAAVHSFLRSGLIRRSTVKAGDGSCVGGGIYLENNGSLNSVLIEESSIHGNRGGAGLHVSGSSTDVTVHNTTLYNNGDTTGGALGASNLRLHLDPLVTMSHVTMMTDGGKKNIQFDFSVAGGTVRIKNSLLQQESEQDNCDLGFGGTVISDGYNIESSNTCQFDNPTDSVDTDAFLSFTLEDNGGPTETLRFTARSPAIDYIPLTDNPPFAPHCNLSNLLHDQRNAPRVGDCDAGAYEDLGCPQLVLRDEVIFSTREHEECTIQIGPNLTVVGPDGCLTVTSGTSTALVGDVTFEDGAEFAAFHDPALQFVVEELIEAERRRRAVDTPPR